jgi:hypothetical protein
VAWVESPLQLVSAAEYAALAGLRLRVVFRLGAQMPETAAELLERGAPFSECVPYVGIPWAALAGSRTWVVGDGFSGHFRLAAAVLRPSEVALLDDGELSLRLAEAIARGGEFSRSGAPESGIRTLLGGLTRDHLLGLAARGRLVYSSVYGIERTEFAGLERVGARLVGNRFAWTRSAARQMALPVDRVVLGTARVADGLRSEAEHRAWVAAVVGDGAVYLPHRREDPGQVARLGEIPGLKVIDRRLPAELLLAGSEDLEIVSSGSSADTTLRLVLDGSGSRLHAGGAA